MRLLSPQHNPRPLVGGSFARSFGAGELHGELLGAIDTDGLRWTAAGTGKRARVHRIMTVCSCTVLHRQKKSHADHTQRPSSATMHKILPRTHPPIPRATLDLRPTPSPSPTLRARCPVARTSLPRVVEKKGRAWWSYMAGDARHERNMWLLARLTFFCFLNSKRRQFCYLFCYWV